MKLIKDFLKKRKTNQIRKKISQLQEEAMYFQRNGKLRHYASVMEQIQQLEQEIVDG